MQCLQWTCFVNVLMPLITRSRTVVKRGGIVPQCYTIDSQTRESGTNLVLPCRSLDKFVHATLLQFTVFLWMSTWKWWIYVNEFSSRIKCSMAERFSEKSTWCSIEQVCQGVMSEAFWAFNWGLDSYVHPQQQENIHYIYNRYLIYRGILAW